MEGFWSNYEPPRARMREGRATFPLVEIGLELELEMRCDAWENGTIWRAPGPKVEQEIAVLALKSIADVSPPDLPPSRACIVENNARGALRWVSVCATSPSNDAFAVCFVPEDAHGLDDRDFELHFPGHRTAGTYWHPVEGSEHGHRGFELASGDEDAVAQSFGVPIARHGERPYRLEATFSAEHGVVPPGSDIAIAVRLENRGLVPVTFDAGSWQRAANRHARFHFEIRRNGELLPDIDRSESWGGIADHRVLEPGGVWEDAAYASRWANFDEPGVYDLRATYDLDVQDTPCPFLAEPNCPMWLSNYVDEYSGRLEIIVK
jgi:hypothetical protein